MKEKLDKTVRSILREGWVVRQGIVVPTPESITLKANEGVQMEAAMLYADMVGSTKMVADRKPEQAAEFYRCFLHVACEVIREFGGTIASFDGDRVMAVFVGEGKESRAATSALKINGAIAHIVNPAITSQYPFSGTPIRHVVGVASGKILAARTGIRGFNDIVWVGDAANLAAKMCDIRDGDLYKSYVTETVYYAMDGLSSYGPSNETMWSRYYHPELGALYRSSWWWKL